MAIRRRVSYRAAARGDLASILDYITRESGSLKVARRFVDQLRQKCLSLTALPGMLGRARPELHPGLRSVAFKGYVIFFRYDGDLFEVVTILEGHRDIPTYFRDEQI